MAGVDVTNQFPNSRMAGAVRVGQSQFRSVDSSAVVVAGEQHNVAIAGVTSLTVPITATYAVLCAVGGQLYYTYDGSNPSAASYAGTLTAGQMLPILGRQALAAIKVIGTSMSVSYWR